MILTVGISMMMPMILMSPPTLTLPVDCEVGVECFIQNHVDLAPAKDSAKDYHCGDMTYDGHKGTDFRTRNLVQMEKGVNVVAAADGTVLRVRDGMPDTSIRSNHAPNVEGSECGNGLVISHSNGFETQYCHLKQGSLTVTPNQKVKRGDTLGKIGLSGSTEFPHLHFGLRNKKGEVIDPFAGKMLETDCANHTEHTNLWHSQYRKELAYSPTHLLSYGFSNKRPNAQGARAGNFSSQTLTTMADPFIFWADAMGLQDGDAIIMMLYGQDRVPLVNHSQKITGNKAEYFQFIGSRLKNGAPWKAGTYTGSYRIMRGDENIIDKKVTIELKDTATHQD